MRTRQIASKTRISRRLMSARWITDFFSPISSFTLSCNCKWRTNCGIWHGNEEKRSLRRELYMRETNHQRTVNVVNILSNRLIYFKKPKIMKKRSWCRYINRQEKTIEYTKYSCFLSLLQDRGLCIQRWTKMNISRFLRRLDDLHWMVITSHLWHTMRNPSS